MNKFLIGAVIAVLVVVGGYFLYNSTMTGNAVNDSSPSSDVETITLRSSHFRFFLGEEESPVIKVKEGQMVKVVLNNEEGFHDWVLDEFDASTEQVPAGKTTTVEFVADKKGTYEYYCSVGQHRANGMKGTFIVE